MVFTEGHYHIISVRVLWGHGRLQIDQHEKSCAKNIGMLKFKHNSYLRTRPVCCHCCQNYRTPIAFCRNISPSSIDSESCAIVFDLAAMSKQVLSKLRQDLFPKNTLSFHDPQKGPSDKVNDLTAPSVDVHFRPPDVE